MAQTIPTTEPSRFVAGDTVKWTISDLSDYPIAEGWSLKYALRSASDSIDVTATVVDGAHSVTLTAADTAQYGAGSWTWRRYVERTVEETVERYTVGSGRFVVEEVGGSSHNERMLAAIEAVLEGRVPADVQSFQINGRGVNQIPVEELQRLRSRYSMLVSFERNPDARITHEVEFVAH